MHASRRYRDNAAECLLAAQEASQPRSRKLHLSIAISWLSLARKYEAIEHLFQETGEAALIKGAHYPRRGRLLEKQCSAISARARMAIAEQPEEACAQREVNMGARV
jgi:hypothetical protein